MQREYLSALILAFSVFSLLVWRIRQSSTGLEVIKIHGSTALLGLALFVSIIATCLHGPWYGSLQDLLRYLSLLILVLLVSNSKPADLNFHFLQDCYLMVLGLSGLLLILHFVTGVPWGFADLNPEDGIAFTLGNRNHFGAVCLILLFSSAPRLGSVKGLLSKLLVLFCIASGLGLCLFSGSRGVTLVLLLGLGLVALFFGYQLKLWRSPLLLCAILFSCFGAIFVYYEFFLSDLVKNKLLELGQNQSDYGRLSIWLSVCGMIFDDWFTAIIGHGNGYLYEQVFVYSTENLKHRLRLDSFAHAHNEYLDIILESGLVGLLSCVGAFVLVIKFLLHKVLSIISNPTQSKRLNCQFLDYLGIIVAIITMLAMASFTVAYRYTVVLVPLALLLATILREPDFPSFGSFSFRLRKPLAAVLLLFSVFTCLFFSRQFISDHYYLKYTLASNAWLKLSANEGGKITPHELSILPEEFWVRYNQEKLLNYLRNEAARYMDLGLLVNPNHLRLLFKRYERVAADRSNFSHEDVVEAFEAVDSLVPNAAGLWTAHADYLASANRIEEAILLAKKEARRDFYNFAKALDVLYFEAMRNSPKGMRTAAARMIEKAALAEIQRGSDVIIGVSLGDGIVSITFQDSSRAAPSVMDIDVNIFLHEMFEKKILSKSSLRQQVVSSFHEIFSTCFKIETPVFLENFRYEIR